MQADVIKTEGRLRWPLSGHTVCPAVPGAELLAEAGAVSGLPHSTGTNSAVWRLRSGQLVFVGADQKGATGRAFVDVVVGRSIADLEAQLGHAEANNGSAVDAADLAALDAARAKIAQETR